MKLRSFFYTLLLFIATSSFAQDTICKSNGSKIVGKVLEVNPDSIKYKIQNNGTEIPVVTTKSEIVYVVYSNGVKEVFGTTDTNKREFSSVVQPPSPEKKGEVKENNIIAINFLDLLFTNFTLSYERFSKSGLWSVKVPVSVGFGGYYNDREYIPGSSAQFLRNRLYSGGLELNIYPLKRTRNTFYAGISVAAGSFVYYDYILPPRPPNYGGTGNMYLASAELVKHIGAHYSGMLHVGGYLALNNHILIGAKVAAGAKLEDTVEPDYLQPKLQVDFNLAYRF